jgi:hypothetical protein
MVYVVTIYLFQYKALFVLFTERKTKKHEENTKKGVRMLMLQVDEFMLIFCIIDTVACR